MLSLGWIGKKISSGRVQLLSAKYFVSENIQSVHYTLLTSLNRCEVQYALFEPNSNDSKYPLFHTTTVTPTFAFLSSQT